ncbi:hypothetical protein TKK_0008958 [Trichogramma kaykai]|uniref:Uncharacterized protein n=1 Tax=Trichogramma kaykai TaxID=54128 RepID=A0ABD2X2U2_9HYME
MAGALSESAPKPVSVVRVEAEPPLTPPAPSAVAALLAPALDQQQQQQQQATTAEPISTDEVDARPPAAPPLVRSFVSTEAQTELQTPPLLLPPPGADLLSEELRDARRRERRMRRHHRRAMQRANANAAAAAAVAAANNACGVLPPPPSYPGLVPAGCAPVPPPVAPAGGSAVPLVGPTGHFLHPPPPHLGLRGLSLGLPFPVPASVSAFGRDAVPKQCCGLGSPPVRWSILGVGVVGLVCAGAGALLGALRATGRDHIAVALLMIGIGVVLVTVSAVAWRVTSRENCGGFFGLTGISGRIPPARPMHPYAAMIYPEFQFRTPPPSYQASMQEYRLRLLLLDRLQPTSSPPPTYRSNSGSYVQGGGGVQSPTSNQHHHQHASVLPVVSQSPGSRADPSRPPSYCGHHRLSSNGSQGHHHHHHHHHQHTSLVPSKKDANLVRIVQTESEPVILSGDQTPPCAAVEVLAHL